MMPLLIAAMRKHINHPSLHQIKQTVLIAWILCCIGSIVNAQVVGERGGWLVGLTPVSFSPLDFGRKTSSETITSYEVRNTFWPDSVIQGRGQNSNFYRGAQSTSITFSLNLNAAYFVTRHLSVGAGVSLDIPSGSFSSHYPSIPTSLYVKYYVLPTKSEISIEETRREKTSRHALFVMGTVTGAYSFIREKGYPDYDVVFNEQSNQNYLYGMQVGIGYLVLVSRRLAFELTASYFNTTLGIKRENHLLHRNDTEEVEMWISEHRLSNRHGFNLSIGLQYNLHNKSSR
jgi:hypothetical protein